MTMERAREGRWANENRDGRDDDNRRDAWRDQRNDRWREEDRRPTFGGPDYQDRSRHDAEGYQQYGQRNVSWRDREDTTRPWRPYDERARQASSYSDRADAWRHGDDRYGDRGRDRMNERREGGRDWWDKTRDEVSSWFGDDDADRRREHDRMTENHRGRGPRGYVRSDDRIREDVNDRLTDDPVLDARDIEVSVKDGEVTLSGEVGSRYSKRLAEDITERVSGVKNVLNSLRVRDRNAAARDSGAAGNTERPVVGGVR